jgi:hypothetical protein
MTDMECVDEWATAVEKFTADRMKLSTDLHQGDLRREEWDKAIRRLNRAMMERWDEIRAQCPKAPL